MTDLCYSPFATETTEKKEFSQISQWTLWLDKCLGYVRYNKGEAEWKRDDSDEQVI